MNETLCFTALTIKNHKKKNAFRRLICAEHAREFIIISAWLILLSFSRSCVYANWTCKLYTTIIHTYLFLHPNGGLYLPIICSSFYYLVGSQFFFSFFHINTFAFFASHKNCDQRTQINVPFERNWCCRARRRRSQATLSIYELFLSFIIVTARMRTRSRKSDLIIFCNGSRLVCAASRTRRAVLHYNSYKLDVVETSQ